MTASLASLRVFPVSGLFLCVFLVSTAPGAGALQFLKPAPLAMHGFLGMNKDIDCSTDNPNATVTLLHQPYFTKWIERSVTPKNLILKRQVFTLLNLTVDDAGRYNCKATDGQQTIRWPLFYGMMVLSQVALPDYFELIPRAPIIVLRGGDAQITCETEGYTVSTLQWKKQTVSGEVNVSDVMVTNEKDPDRNLVRAILKITNAQPRDGGSYKCVLTALGMQDQLRTAIRVDDPTPPTITPIDGPRTITEGTQKVIKCVARASPKPTMHWYKNDKKLNTTSCTGPDDKSCENVIYEVYEENPGSALHRTYTEQVLKIRSALYPRDQGEFECRAMNGVEPPAKLVFGLDVQAVPKLDKSSDTVLVNGGVSTEVSCSVDNSNPLPTFTWEYQNFKCANCRSDKNQWKPVPGNLIITPTNTPTNHSVVQVEKHQPSTYYRCKADNILGQDTHVVKLVRICDKL